MALQFFYRRQKMVFLIMVILMVSFLIGFQGFSLLCDRRGGSEFAGKTKYGPIAMSRNTASMDLQILRNIYRTDRIAPTLDARAFYVFYKINGDDPLTYALLLEDARKQNINVTAQDVNDTLTALGLTGDAYKELLQALKTGLDDEISDKSLRATLTRWLTIADTCTAGQIDAMPSEPELQYAYSQQYEKVRLAVLHIPTNDFMTQAARESSADPAAWDKRVQEQFQKYRDAIPRKFNRNDKLESTFGFGYRQDNRVSLRFVIVNPEAIQAALGLDFNDQASQNIMTTRDEYARKQARKLLEAWGRLTEPPTDWLAVYRQAGIVLPESDARAMLDVTLPTVQISQKPLSDAIEELTALAGKKVHGLKRILLPPEVANLASTKVSYIKADVKIGQAIDALIDQAWATSLATSQPASNPATNPASQPSRPAWKWVFVDGLDGVLFPAGGDIGAAMLPVSDPTETGLMTPEQLTTNWPIFRMSATQDGRQIKDIVSNADAFASDPKTASVSTGEIADKELRLITMLGQSLVWQLVTAAPAGPLDKPTTGVIMQASQDVEIEAAMQLAASEAGKIKERADQLKVSLLDIKTNDFKVAGGLQTEWTARHMDLAIPISDDPSNSAYDWGYPVDTSLALLDRNDIQLANRYSTPENLMETLTRLGIRKIPATCREQVMTRIFDLAKTATPSAIEVIPVAFTREVLVVQVLGYEPPAKDEYLQKRSAFVQSLAGNKAYLAYAYWFNAEDVKKRTGYKP